MNVAIEKLPECRARISAEVPANTVEEIRKAVITAFMKEAKIPGFRPGKLPRKVVEQKFGINIDMKVKEQLTRNVLNDAVQRQNLDLLGFSKIEREVFEADGTFSFNAEVILKPEVEITENEYKNIPVTVIKHEVNEATVDAWLLQTQLNLAVFEESADPVEHGDHSMVTYTAQRDGEPLEQQIVEELSPVACRKEPFELLIPQKTDMSYEIIPGLAKGIVGASPGETRDIEVEFNENYFIETLRGTKATYTVDICSNKKPKLQPIDDDFAKKFGKNDLQTLKEEVSALQKQRIEQARVEQIENQILEHLNKEHQFELPQEAVISETKFQFDHMVINAYKRGMKEEELESQKEEIVETATARAVANLRTRYILSVVSTKEKITVSNEELSRYIVLLAKNENKPFKKFVRELRDKKGIVSLQEDILIRKTIAFLREHASITEIEQPTNSSHV